MPLSKEWPYFEKMGEITYSCSRPLCESEAAQSEHWLATQMFKGQVYCDLTLRIRGDFRTGAYFADPADLLLFKIAWG